MRSASFSRSRFALLALPVVLVACGQSRPEARTASAAQVEVAAQAPHAAHAAHADDASELPLIHIYKTPTCGCCGDWVDHIEQAGFRVEVQDLPNLTAIKQRTGVPQHLASCHTSLVGDYVVEGHVPASTIRRLLAEKPAIAGIAVPGMPVGSPGMEHGDHKDPYDVIAFTRDGRGMVYESH